MRGNCLPVHQAEMGPPGYWLHRPVLITGATGFLGACLVKRLLVLGADITCLVRDWVPQAELVRSQAIEQVKVVRGDVCDQALLERVLSENEINQVIHLAAQTVVSTAHVNPISTYKTNIEGTWSLLEAARRSSSVKQIIVASSDKAYGDHGKATYDETMPLHGIYPYDVSKSCADLIAQSYAFTYKLPVVITRCGNFYGGGDLNWNRIVPGTIRSVLFGTRPVLRSNGGGSRDYLYIEDGVNAYLKLAEYFSEHPDIKGEAFNFSAGESVTTLSLVTHILTLMNSDLEPDIQNKFAYDLAYQHVSIEKSKKQLHWQAEYSLHQGLKRTITWYKEYFGYAE